jgi:cytoskeletal protein CcmA (bactofilin family)
VVFRRDSKVDAFQRQISALRHQLGGEGDDYRAAERDRSLVPLDDNLYRSDLPDLDSLRSAPSLHPAHPHEQMPDAGQMAPYLPPVPAIDTQTSVIAHTTTWNGNLESSGSLHLHGRVEGSVTARNDIFIAEEAEIDAVVQAASVTVAGNVRGSIQCSDRFEVLPRGRVAGDVRAPVIVVHEGATIVGEISMSATSETRPSTMIVGSHRAARGGD